MVEDGFEKKMKVTMCMKQTIKGTYVSKTYVAILIFMSVSLDALSQTITHWWNDTVFYEVFVRSYKDSDGDGIGDFKGLIDYLDYLNDGDSTTHSDLGITGIWLMPIQQSPSYHGYDVIDYRTVETDYGTNQDFKDFIDAAHDRGIKVIMDYVMNHTSSQHPWFQSSVNSLDGKRDWYIWENPKPAGTGPWGQNVWHSRNGSYNYGIFWSEMPDLNYNTPEVKTEMFDIAEFWLDSMNVDGFRLDAIKYIYEDGADLEDLPETIGFWKDFTDHYKAIDSNVLAVGEAWTSTDKVQPYTTDSTLDYCFEFDLATQIMNTANTGNITGLQSQIDEVIATYPYLQYGTFLTNHDMNRVMNQLGSNTTKAKLASQLLLTLPGVPYIYYGEEIGMTGVKPDENIRKPLQWNSSTHAGFTTGTPWRAVNADYTTKNIGDQKLDEASLWNNYRNLIAIRNNQVALRKGDYSTVSTNSTSVISFLRSYNNENIVVITNAGASTAAGVEISIATSSIMPGTYAMAELQGGSLVSVTVDGSGGFTGLAIGDIPARSTLIYKLLDPAEVTTSVTFQVDMREMIKDEDFAPLTETVDIVADFNSFGTDSIVILSDLDGDSIYSIEVPNLEIGDKQSYKYRINGVNYGREEFAGKSYLRSYLILEGVNTVLNTYQKELISALDKDLSLKVSVYPIPTENSLWVAVSQDVSGLVSGTITDMLGTERGSFVYENTEDPYMLSLDELSSGMYLIYLEHNGSCSVRRVVVQR